MSTRRMFIVALGGVLFIALLMGISALYSLLLHGQREFSLPDAQDSPPQQTGDAEESAHSGARLVTVTSGNVQDVIRRLRRPESYSRDIMVETFWTGGNAVYNIGVTVMGGVSSMRSVTEGDAKNIVVTGDKLYIWYEGDTAPYEGARGSDGDARRTADEYQMLITYEDILGLGLGPGGITDAGYVEYGGSRCIFAEFRSGELGYTTRCYISPELGLVMGAEEYDGDTLIYKMTTGACSVGEQNPQAFALPDGRSALPSGEE